MVTEDGNMSTAKFLWDSHEVRVDDISLAPVNKHEKCKENHYHDPYTKIEYCLPEDFTNVEMLHLYRVWQIFLIHLQYGEKFNRY